MSKLTNQTCQQIEEQFLIDFQRFYDITKEDLVMNCKRKLLNEEYPLEFFQYLYRTKKLAKYAILLTKLPTDLYDVNSELIYNGLKWFTIAYSRYMNPYIHKRNKDKRQD